MPNAHGSLVNAVIAYIGARGGYAFKVQTGVLPVAGRYVHAGKPGVPDVVGVWPTVLTPHMHVKATCEKCGTVSEANFDGEPDMIGRLIAVEVKTGTGRLSAVQKRVHAELEKRGALVVTVRNIGELEKALA